MQRFPMTVAGAAQLKAELENLVSVERPRIVANIAEARAHGDLKENAEYHAAREEQGLLEARVRDIEAKLAQSQIIDVSKLENTGKVIFGATIKLVDLDTDKEVTYQIVGDDESDLSTGKISVGTPIARALIGKEEGEEVLVRTPGGEVTYEILEVLYV